MNEQELKMETENTAHTALRAVIASLVFCVAFAGFFHCGPMHARAGGPDRRVHDAPHQLPSRCRRNVCPAATAARASLSTRFRK